MVDIVYMQKEVWIPIGIAIIAVIGVSLIGITVYRNGKKRKTVEERSRGLMYKVVLPTAFNTSNHPCGLTNRM